MDTWVDEPSLTVEGGAPFAVSDHQRLDVLIVLHDLRGGGAERAMLRLATGMASHGLQVEILLIQRAGAYLGDVPSGVTLSSLGAKSVAAALFPIARYIRRRKPRSVLSALTHVNLVVILGSRLARFRGRVVVSERNHISSKFEAATSFREKIAYRLIRYIYPLASTVSAVSKGVADDLVALAKLPDGKVTYVYNPVFDEGLVEKTKMLPSHRWLLSSGTPVIVAFGRLHPQKAFPLLIEAFAKLRRSIDAKLIIFGEGIERQSLEAAIASSGFKDEIDLPGFNDQPLAAMANAQVLVLSSRWEGFPNVLVEGLACGITVVSTNCPSGPDEILDGGNYGFLVEMDNVDALADGLRRAIMNPFDNAFLKARAAIFTVDAAVSQYANLLGVSDCMLRPTPDGAGKEMS